MKLGNTGLNKRSNGGHLTETQVYSTSKTLPRLSNFSLRPNPFGIRTFHGMPMSTSEEPSDTVVIDLTVEEEGLFELLLQVVDKFKLNTQLRVAGGWVRDKLLKKDSHDIDIALDNKSGREFCEKVNEYLEESGLETQRIGDIKRNPDKSKHLETAKMRVHGLEIDFVNLRSEGYCENSRIPTMISGNAKEDAHRRDLTINSLFYNINTRSVEDLTGRGIADLRSGKIVTPSSPKRTLLDDPLRVLRAIRFGARFEFTLDGELKRAASTKEVKSAIDRKISRERIGHEIDLMVSGNQPVKAIQYISDLELFWVVFRLPPEVVPFISAESDKNCVAYMNAGWRLLQLPKCSSNFNDEENRLALYSTLFLPLRDTAYKDNKAKKVPVVSYIFRNSLKLKASDAERVINVHNATKKFLSLIPFIISKKEEPQKLRVLAGLILREIKEFWRVALLASILLYPSEIKHTDLSADQLELERRIETFKTIEGEILDLGLEKVWEMKPLVNGNKIMEVLQLNTGTPLVKKWQKDLIEWQLAHHPSGTLEECLDWMSQTHSKRARRE